MMEYTKRRNLNRGFMKLEAWQRGMDLFVMAARLSTALSDLKLKSQFGDAEAQQSIHPKPLQRESDRPQLLHPPAP
jgi:hypothetical protein